MALNVESIAEIIAQELVALDSIAVATTANQGRGELLLLTQGGQPFKVTVRAEPALDEELISDQTEMEPGAETEPEEAEDPAC